MTNAYIAIVDDDDAVRKALLRFLRASDIDAVAYTSGGEFLDSLAEGYPDCVILDLRMPGLTGFDVQNYLGHSNIRIPVIIMTGHDDEGAEARCLSAGAYAFLRKPIDETLLLNAIQTAVSNR